MADKALRLYSPDYVPYRARPQDLPDRFHRGGIHEDRDRQKPAIQNGRKTARENSNLLQGLGIT